MNGLTEAPPLRPFDGAVIEFFDDLSKALMKERTYSDVTSFGFWCRKAMLLKEKERYGALGTRLGKGIVFHSTPSNVPVNFAFSFMAGLLAGNANIVRLPAKDFEQTDIIVNAVQILLENRHRALKPYLYFVKYPPDKEMNDRFSAVCDVRVVWGGDGTVNEMRRSPLKPRATEITFADRYSTAVIHTESYLNAAGKKKIAQDFYNDTYFSDQNACTAPRAVFWLGPDKEKAKHIFWEEMRLLAEEKYALTPIQAVNKLAAFYKAAAGLPVSNADIENNYITRVGMESADAETMRFKYNSGFFFEYGVAELKEILPLCGERLQTLTYFGFEKEELTSFLLTYTPKGIDRIVPMGEAMRFSLTWDGYDLIRLLSREIIVY